MNMPHTTSGKEHYPSTDGYVDAAGDFRHIDDDPEGFSPVGHTPDSEDYFRGDAVVDERYDFEPEEELGVYVNLGERAVKLLEAVDSFSSASMLVGLVKSNDRAKIAYYHGEEAVEKKIREHVKAGKAALRAAYGIEVMLAKPHMILDKLDGSYDEQKADDEMVAVNRNFLNTYTSEGVRSMGRDATLREKGQKGKRVTVARNQFRKTLKRQLPQ